MLPIAPPTMVPVRPPPSIARPTSAPAPAPTSPPVRGAVRAAVEVGAAGHRQRHRLPGRRSCSSFFICLPRYACCCAVPHSTLAPSCESHYQASRRPVSGASSARDLPGQHRPLDAAAPSGSRRARPALRSARWQGISQLTGLRPTAVPTARTAVGCPTARGDVGIGGHVARGHLQQRLPDLDLERRADQVQPRLAASRRRPPRPTAPAAPAPRRRWRAASGRADRRTPRPARSPPAKARPQSPRSVPIASAGPNGASKPPQAIVSPSPRRANSPGSSPPSAGRGRAAGPGRRARLASAASSRL